MCLPFNDFQVGVFQWLQLAPFQLHPNALAFMRAFELVCQYLQIGVMLPLVFRIFHLQRQSIEGGQAWVSFKQFGKLFPSYLESICHFKERYFVMKPLTDVAVTSLYERSEVVEEGHTLFQLNARFPLEW